MIYARLISTIAALVLLAAADAHAYKASVLIDFDPKSAGQTVIETKCESLRRFTDDVREVQAGFECGISLEGFDAFQEGDVFEFYHREREN